MLRPAATAFVLLLCSGSLPAHADVARLSATYDSFLENAVFTITNDSASAETVMLGTSLGPSTGVTLPGTLAAGASEQYAFSAPNGGFLPDPQGEGVPDTTTYDLVVGFGNGLPAVASAAFSPLSNQTGGDVDFLGNQCQGFAGGACGATIALSGLVASGAEPVPVPEPLTVSIFVLGLAGLGLAVRRAG